MIIQLIGYERHSFTDKETGREVVYHDIHGIEPQFSHQRKNCVGCIARNYRMSRVNPINLTEGDFYEVVFDIKTDNKGGYTARPQDLRRVDPDIFPKA